MAAQWVGKQFSCLSVTVDALARFRSVHYLLVLSEVLLAGELDVGLIQCGFVFSLSHKWGDLLSLPLC